MWNLKMTQAVRTFASRSNDLALILGTPAGANLLRCPQVRVHTVAYAPLTE